MGWSHSITQLQSRYAKVSRTSSGLELLTNDDCLSLCPQTMHRVWPLKHFNVQGATSENCVRSQIDREHWETMGAAAYADIAKTEKDACKSYLEIEANNFVRLACQACQLRYKPLGQGAVGYLARSTKTAGDAWRDASADSILKVADKLMYIFGGQAHIKCFMAYHAAPLHTHAARKVMDYMQVKFSEPPKDNDEKAHDCVSKLCNKLMNDRRRTAFLRSEKTHKTRLSVTDPFNVDGKKKKEKKDSPKAETEAHRRLTSDRGTVLAYNRGAGCEFYYVGFHSSEKDESGMDIDVFTWGQVSTVE